MSGITLTSSVRQNLLSLQSTAELLSTTQSRLSTGNKVNSALDNPTNFFTAQNLNSRASDISNLLDGIGNGVQILQSANTGITSLQKLVDSAKSIANQALQTTVGYAKSSATSATNKGITAGNLLGTTAAVISSATGTSLVNNASATYQSAIVAGTTVVTTDQLEATGPAVVKSSALQVPGVQNIDTLFAGGNITAADGTTLITGAMTLDGMGGSAAGKIDLSGLTGALVINGKSITFDDSGTTTGNFVADGTGFKFNVSASSTATMDQLLAKIDELAGNTDSDPLNHSAVVSGHIVLHTGDGTSGVDFTGSNVAVLTELGLNSLTDSSSATVTPATSGPLTLATGPGGPTVNASLTSKLSDLGLTDGQSFLVGTTEFKFATTPASGSSDINLTTGTVADLLQAMNDAFGTAAGHATAALGTGPDAGKLVITGTASANLTLADGTTTGGLAALGLTAATTPRPTGAPATALTITGATKLAGAASLTVPSLTTDIVAGDKFTVNGKTISFYDSVTPAGPTDPNITYLNASTATVDDVLAAIDTITGASGSTVAGGKITLNTGVAQNLDLAEVGAGTVLAKLGLAAGTTNRQSTPATAQPITDGTLLSGAVGTNSLASGFAAGNSIVVNGTTINFVAANATGNDVNITDSIDDLLAKIDAITGGSDSKVVGGKIQLNASTSDSIILADGSAGSLAKLGLVAGTTSASTPAGPSLSGQTLTIGATGGNGVATTITFGIDDAAGEVSTLDELNKKLAANNLQASVSTTGAITLTTTNDAASSNIGALSGTTTDLGGIFAGVTVHTAQADANSQATRASLVAQYNQVIDQIKTTAQDSSFNGVNLLNGDTLSLTFNETGSSKLNITGVNFGPEGLGLSSLLSGADFIDNASTNKILIGLTKASTTLRSQASAFGSNLSVVQIRQDFSKNLINVLQSGASNLTLADTNEEAANSQALSTRQSIAVSALALANSAQQGVLQLLR